MSDKRDKLKATIERVFKPLVEGLAVHSQNLEFWIHYRQIGVFAGIVIEIRPDKADAPRIYGKSRQNYNALCVVAESIGFLYSIPVKLGTMHDAIVHSAEEGRHWRDRAEPINGIEPLAHIHSLLNAVSAQIFKGDEPRVDLQLADGGGIEFTVHVSPSSPRVLQKQWEALQTLFRAICAPYGWLPNISMEKDLGLIERQPPTAAGRYAPEVKRH